MKSLPRLHRNARSRTGAALPPMSFRLHPTRRTLAWSLPLALTALHLGTGRLAAASLTALGDLPGRSFQSRADSVSGDGSVVVGSGVSASGIEAFRWTTGGMVGLGDLPGGGFHSSANGVSGDGSVVVGYGSSASGTEAFRWTTGGMVGLGDLPGGSFDSYATDVSGDGSVVVGASQSANGTEAFRWTTGGMVGLGDLPGGSFYSYATDVSGDGSVVVGAGQSASGEEAFLWTAGGEMKGLYALLQADGVDLTGWSRLERAQDISSDGRYVVGWGIRNNGNTEAFLADLGPQGAEVPEASTWAAVGALALAVGHTARAHAKRRGAQSASGLAHSTT